MRLLFCKDEQGDISVKFIDVDGYTDFSYADMIKRIYDDQIIEDPELQGSFSEKEKKSISDLIDSCRNAIFEGENQSEKEKEEFDDLDFLF